MTACVCLVVSPPHDGDGEGGLQVGLVQAGEGGPGVVRLQLTEPADLLTALVTSLRNQTWGEISEKGNNGVTVPKPRSHSEDLLL